MPARVREFFTYGTGYPSPRDLRPSPREEEEATEPVTGRRRLGQCPRNRDTSCTVRAGQRTTARIFALHTPQLYQDFARNRELPPCRSGKSDTAMLITGLLFAVGFVGRQFGSPFCGAIPSAATRSSSPRCPDDRTGLRTPPARPRARRARARGSCWASRSRRAQKKREGRPRRSLPLRSPGALSAAPKIDSAHPSLSDRDHRARVGLEPQPAQPAQPHALGSGAHRTQPRDPSESSRRTISAPAPNAASLARATVRGSGAMPQLVEGHSWSGSTN